MSIAVTSPLNTIVVHPMSGLRTFEASRPGLHGYTGLGMGALGDVVDPDTVGALASAGYDPATISVLAQMGASDQQLQNLPYGPGTTYDDMDAGLLALMKQLPISPGSNMNVGTAASLLSAVVGGAVIVVALLLLRK